VVVARLTVVLGGGLLGEELTGVGGQRTAATRTGSGWRLCTRGEGGGSFIVDARACRGTAIPRPWYGAQGGTPRGPSVRRVQGTGARRDAKPKALGARDIGKV
jgi:hypothetical protein